MDTVNYAKILTEFKNKASLKQAVYRNTTEVFELLKKQLIATAGRFANLVTVESLTDIIERSILICLASDLIIPPYAQIKEVTLNQKQSMLAASGYPTGKHPGYQFKAETEQNNNL
ncbi:hypothetical protein OQX61_10380 [Pedobacter sp. PLR]|uniref:hypothetical protein n=1 Tax=Pedobacter sp. PLR TaxID=2994465 RepID=UPI002245A7BD|nr:hypothetical protein [Pedobacter sp. PLR]MCX2451670.1 hypothetical protein [Pedobacter sp. PLR]